MVISPQVAQQPAPSIAQPQVAQSAPQVSDNAQAQEEVYKQLCHLRLYLQLVRKHLLLVMVICKMYQPLVH
jgi:hypothetical protein